MKFGAVTNMGEIDLSLPKDAKETNLVLNQNKANVLEIFVGCAKWNSTDLKGFYPKTVKKKEELNYYASQFNSIELNATFYKMPSLTQVEKWRDCTPNNFRFCPKISNSISHFKRLRNVENELEMFCNNIAASEDRLGSVFLQLHDNFQPKDFDILQNSLTHFPVGIPLALELRNHSWYDDPVINNQLCDLLEEKNISHIIVDTLGRRDLLHMRLSNGTAFVRFVGANVDSDLSRLDEWVERIAIWEKEGLSTLYFFIHQNIELDSPLLAAYFIKKLNEKMGTQLSIPLMADASSNSDNSQTSLF